MSTFNLEERQLPGLQCFKDISKEDFDHNFRATDKALLHHFDIEEYELSGVVLAAPLNFALCAVEDLSVITRSMVVWPERDYFNEVNYKKLNKMLRSLGISKSSLHPYFLIWLNSTSYQVGHGYKNLLDYKGKNLGEYRFSAHVTSRERQKRLIEIYKVAVAQFGAHAFCCAPEGTDYDKHNEPWSYRFQEFDPLCVFLSPRKPEIGLYVSGREREEGISRSALHEAISALEAGGKFPWDMHYKNLVRPPVSVPFLPNSNSDPRFELWQLVDFELLSLRCRLIRLLGWPQMFGVLTSKFNPNTGAWEVLARYATDHQRECLANAIKGLELPYDPIQELDSYIAEMIQKYPVLMESPF